MEGTVKVGLGSLAREVELVDESALRGIEELDMWVMVPVDYSPHGATALLERQAHIVGLPLQVAPTFEELQSAVARRLLLDSLHLLR